MTVNDDVRKYIELFVEIRKQGEVIPYSDEYEKYVVNNIRESSVDRWKRFLSQKYCEYDAKNDMDGYDEWFDNLTSADQIDEKEIKIYDLPSSKIVVSIGNEEVLMHKVFELYSAALAEVKPYCKPGELNACMNFNKANAEFSIWSMAKDVDTKEYKKSLSIATKVFNNVNKQMQVLTKEFNNAQSEDNVHIAFHSSKSNVAEELQTSYEKGGFIVGSSFERVLSITRHSVNVYYPNGNKVEESYLDRLFSIIPDQMVFAVKE